MNEALEGEIVNQSPVLRLTKHDENIVLLLETAFHNGYNITEACQQAGISRTTFYEWLADDDVFSYRMSVAQTALGRKAKTNLMQAIDQGDPSISLRYLMLRDPDFKPRGDIDIHQETFLTTEAKLKEFLDDTDDGAYNDQRGQSADTSTSESRGEVADSPTDIS